MTVGPLLRRLSYRADPLHPRRAEFEFRDLAERVERRVGQEIRGGLDISERDEHDAVRDGVVLARVKLDRAAPRGDADAVARGNSELCDLAARKVRDWARLERIEHRGAARHRAGVPMLELPAGREHQRILRVWQFVGRRDARWHQLAA